MKSLGIVIQGKTFLKSMIPLCLFANKEGLVPHLIMFRQRIGKPHDNLNFSELQASLNSIANALKQNIQMSFSIVDSEEDVYNFCLNYQLDGLVGQDPHYHLKTTVRLINSNPSLKTKVFSICNFFDTLHHACDLSKKNQKILEVNGMFFPDERFQQCHENILGNYVRSYSKHAVGNTFYDHFLLDKMLPSKGLDKNGIVFFTTLQNLVSENAQRELEKFLLECLSEGIPIYVKEKLKTPWKFSDPTLNKLERIVEERGIPGTSFSMMLNTRMQISSYSTSAVEAEYFGKPTINIESIEKEALTDSVRRIKHEFGILSPFQEKGAVTVGKDYMRAFLELEKTKISSKEKLTLSSNNSVRILRQIKNCL